MAVIPYPHDYNATFYSFPRYLKYGMAVVHRLYDCPVTLNLQPTETAWMGFLWLIVHMIAMYFFHSTDAKHHRDGMA